MPARGSTGSTEMTATADCGQSAPYSRSTTIAHSRPMPHLVLARRRSFLHAEQPPVVDNHGS